MTQPLFLSRCPLTTTASSRKAIININPFLSSTTKLTTTRPQRQPSSRSYSYRPLPPRTTITTHRPYHSTYQPPLPLHEYTNSQTTILSAALNHVPQHGFTQQALTLGARDSGFLDVSVQLFSRGEFDLVLFWVASRRGLLGGRWTVESIETGGDKGDGLTVSEKVKGLILERLRMNFGVRGGLQGALALMSLPTNIPLSLSELHALSSDILFLAGDTSVDASWYTKRMAVAAIYASAETFMTTLDASATEADVDAAVDAFVERRMQDSRCVAESVDGVWRGLGFLGGSLVGVGRSLGVRV